MIRTVIQQGDAVQPTITVEFDEKEIRWKKFQVSQNPEAPPDLLVAIPGEVLTITEPAVVAKLWKPDRKPGKKKHE